MCFDLHFNLFVTYGFTARCFRSCFFTAVKVFKVSNIIWFYLTSTSITENIIPFVLNLWMFSIIHHIIKITIFIAVINNLKGVVICEEGYWFATLIKLAFWEVPYFIYWEGNGRIRLGVDFEWRSERSGWQRFIRRLGGYKTRKVRLLCIQCEVDFETSLWQYLPGR